MDHSSADWCGSKRGLLILINFYFLGWTAREWFRASCVGRGLDVWNVRAVLVVLDGVRSRAVDWCGSQRGFLILINFYFLGSTAREWFRASCVGDWSRWPECSGGCGRPGW